MKFIRFIPLAALTLNLEAAVTYSEDFSTSLGFFEPLQNTNANVTGGTLNFQSDAANPQNGQGSGVTLDLDQLGVMGSGFMNAAQPINFQFDAVVPASTPAGDELGFYFGPPSSQAQSSNIVNGQNTNGFTFYFNDGGIFAKDGGSGSLVTVLNGLSAGSTVTFDVMWSLVNGQNQGQFNNVFTLAAVGTDINNNAVSGMSTVNGAQNQGLNQVNQYQFSASTTRGLSATIDNFTVSDMAITSIPEPATFALLCFLPFSLCARRRRAVKR